MNKKKGLIFLIIILNSIYILADEKVHDEWHYTGDVFIASKKTFTIHSIDETLTKIEFENKFLNIGNETCDVSDYLKVCVGEIKKDDNASLGYKSSIKIYEMTADLELTRTIDKTSFIIGEDANVEISIKNTGSRDATDINFEDKFPDEIKPKNANGCYIKDHTVFWQGSLWKDQEKKCSYKIEALGKVDYTSKGELSYNNGFEIKSLSKEKELTVEDYALQVETTIERNDIGEEFNFNFKLKNINKDYSVYIPYVRFRIPKEIKIIKKPIDIWEDDNVILFKGEIEPNSEIEYDIKLKGEKAGTYKLKEEVRFLINRIPNEFEKEKDIVIEIREPQINHNIEDSYSSNETINFILKISNPSEKYGFNNPTLNTYGLIEAFYNTPKIKEGEEIIALDKNIKLPGVEEDKIIQFNITLTYETIYNQKITSKIYKDVLIKAPEVVIEEVPEEINVTEVEEDLETGKEDEQEEEITKEKEKRERTEINLMAPPLWAIIFIIIFIVIDSFLVVSIIKKMKE